MNEFYSRIIESAARTLTKEMLIAANIGNMIDEGVVIADRSFFDEPLAARRLDKMVDDEWKNHIGAVKAVLLSFLREAAIPEPEIVFALAHPIGDNGRIAEWRLDSLQRWTTLLQTLKEGLSA